MSLMKRLQSNRKKDGPKAPTIPVPLENYPNVAAILCGYVDGDGQLQGGGNILLIIGNTGDVTACCSPSGADESFWTQVNCDDDFFADIEGALESGRGSWKPKRTKK